MGQLRSAVRAYALTTADQPADLVRKVKTYVTSTGVGEMATLAFLTLDPAARKLRVASAGHFPPLLLTSGGAYYAADCGLTTPLGVFDPDGECEAVLELEAGTTVVLYTDGLVERRGSDLMEGLERLRVVAEEHRGSVEDLCDHLLLELLPEGERSDDVALLAFRV
jgi:serine phosphatase RsbU (regulator of sigma subunit)